MKSKSARVFGAAVILALAGPVAMSTAAAQDNGREQQHGDRGGDENSGGDQQSGDRGGDQYSGGDQNWGGDEQSGDQGGGPQMGERQAGENGSDIGPYRFPDQSEYRRWSDGETLPSEYWSQNYFLNDYWTFGLETPPVGYKWVRYGPDALLIDLRTGEIIRVIYNQFY